MQPYFMPYIGYWQLMKAVDKYVVYDDVNYIKGGWINRNHILLHGEKKLFTITLEKASPYKHINEIVIGDDFVKFIRMLQMNYAKAPYYSDVMNLMTEIISFPNKQLALFIANSFSMILSYLHIDNTKIIISSDLNKNNSLTNKDKVIHICKLLRADTYINAIGGKELYDKNEFEQNGIALKFLQPEITQYRQLGNDFIPNLSIIDVLMFNSVEEVNVMLDNYMLV